MAKRSWCWGAGPTSSKRIPETGWKETGCNTHRQAPKFQDMGNDSRVNHDSKPVGFSWQTASRRAAAKVRTITSYCYSFKNEDLVEVLSPAWSVRTCTDMSTLGIPVDLSLGRGLENLQDSDGGFPISTDLCAVLGLADVQGVMKSSEALANSVHESLLGALLVLKTAAVFQPEWWAETLARVCAQAEQFCLSHVSDLVSESSATVFKTSESLWTALNDLDNPVLDELPGISVLRSCFKTGGRRWSLFELWDSLLRPAETLQQASHSATPTFLCARFHLVDLGTAALNPYDIEKDYPMYRKGN